MDTISRLTHRRFILGQEGLWPGRRFKGLRGTAAAIEQMGALQLDPLNVVARSQDIMLCSRVLDYKPEHLHKAAYKQRKFFDYGTALHLYPMAEFPYWRVKMRRYATHSRFGPDFAKKNAKVIETLLNTLMERGPLGNRDFEGEAASGWNYRGRKDTSLSLYYLWMTGHVMISHRKGFDRYYDLRERVVPAEFDYAAPEAEFEDYFARKEIASWGIMRPGNFRAGWEYPINRPVTRAESDRKMSELLEKGIAVEVKPEGERTNWITLRENLPILECLESGGIPKEWKPPGPTTEQEVTLLAPLENASARGRARQLFGFDYVWEVYKPVHQRRWGYYTLPILYGDDLVARLDPKLDRRTNTLQILGFWLEEDAPPDEAFASALGNGLARFARMAGAEKVDVSAIEPRKLRNHVRKIIR
jgi:uncharacterized protein YcaQ